MEGAKKRDWQFAEQIDKFISSLFPKREMKKGKVGKPSAGLD
jgi:hypothetical protein